jgi:hypothetical protein
MFFEISLYVKRGITPSVRVGRRLVPKFEQKLCLATTQPHSFQIDFLHVVDVSSMAHNPAKGTYIASLCPESAAAR